MARKHKPEDIIGKLREAEVVPARFGAIVDSKHYRQFAGACVWSADKFYFRQFAAKRNSQTG